MNPRITREDHSRGRAKIRDDDSNEPHVDLFNTVASVRAIENLSSAAGMSRVDPTVCVITPIVRKQLCSRDDTALIHCERNRGGLYTGTASR